MMSYLAHTAHLQFFFLIGGFVAWTLTIATVGLNEWRLWYVDNTTVITSGVAWVGIWRACFYSHALTGREVCQSMGVAEAFVPAEISSAQVMMMMAVVCGLAANIAGAAAVRMAYFSMKRRSRMQLAFVLAGSLYLLTGALSLVPLAWNVNSVLANRTINFPPRFNLPAAPLNQQVGSGIAVGMTSSFMMVISGLAFMSYRVRRAQRTLSSEVKSDANNSIQAPPSITTDFSRGGANPAFIYENVL